MQNKFPIAISVFTTTMEETKKGITGAAAKKPNYIEPRVDPIIDLNLQEILEWKVDIPLIITARHRSEAGKDPRAGFKGKEEERLGILQKAIDAGVYAIDIELSHYHNQFKRVGSSTLVLVSSHLSNTPSWQRLMRIYRRMQETDGDVYKIAATACSLDDSLMMLDFTRWAQEQGKPFIGICMGEEGKITRKYGPAYGSHFTFAALDKEHASAPGQIPIDELRKIWALSYFDRFASASQ